MAASNIKVLTLQVDTGTGEIKINGVKSSIEGATKAMNEFNATSAKTSAATKDLGSSAGIAGATVNEFGRLISDMPYGITAITNNISQLGSMFAILVTKTGSVTNAFKSLFATLKASPALLALLAFQAAVAGLELWAQASRKTKKSVDDLSKATAEAGIRLKIARKIITDSNATLKQKETIVREVNEEYKNFNIILDKNGIATKESTEKLNIHIASLEKLAETQGIVNEMQKIYGEIAILNAKTASEAATFWDKVAASAAAGSKDTKLGNYFDNLEKEIEKRGNITREKLNAKFEELLANYRKQLETLFAPPPEKGDKTVKILEDFNELLIQTQIKYLKSLDEVSEEDKRKTIDKVTALNLTLLNIQEEASVKKATEEKRSVDEMLILAESFALKKAAIIRESNSEVLAMMRSFHSELKIDAQEAAENQYLELDVLTPLEDQIKKSTKAVASVMGDEQKRREKATENGNNAVSKLRQDDKIAAIWAAQDLSNGVFGVLESSFQREIDIERNKTNEKNNELRARLADENLSADERRNIQDRIASNDEALRKKQEKIEEKKFKLNKAASIANALVNTYLAASQALSDKTNPSTFAKIAATVAVIGVGLAQVAMIAKQKFVTSQSGLGGFAGSGSVGAGVQAPDFNIVGASPTNQIANAISENERKPIKAYVVSRDVSSAQEMDRNIIGVASLG
jgi:ribosomal protein L16 Arg81 hydroxylase